MSVLGSWVSAHTIQPSPNGYDAFQTGPFATFTMPSNRREVVVTFKVKDLTSQPSQQNSVRIACLGGEGETPLLVEKSVAFTGWNPEEFVTYTASVPFPENTTGNFKVILISEGFPFALASITVE